MPHVELRPLALRTGVTVHYRELGVGPPVVFVHMGGRDYRYWDDELPAFAERGYRAVAYSRRYAFPNRNPPVGDYSPRHDADDLGAVMEALDLTPAHLVASSIGAFAALILATRRPDLVRTLALAEPPVLGWVREEPGDAKEMVDAFMTLVWRAAADHFRQGDAVAAMNTLMSYFVGPAPHAFDAFPPRLRRRVMQNVDEWRAHTTSSDPFPPLDRDAVRALAVPTLLLSGGRTLPMHRAVDARLERLLPAVTRVTVPDATHDVWGDGAAVCRAAVFEALGARGAAVGGG